MRDIDKDLRTEPGELHEAWNNLKHNIGHAAADAILELNPKLTADEANSYEDAFTGRLSSEVADDVRMAYRFTMWRHFNVHDQDQYEYFDVVAGGE